jgi:hypothetical protein
MEESTESFTKNAEKQRKKEIEDVTKIKEYMKDYKDPGGVDTPHIIGKTLDNRRQQDDDAKQNEAALKDTTKRAIQKSILGTDMNDRDSTGPLEERKTSVEDNTEMSLKNHLSNRETTEGQNLRGLSGRGKLLKGHSPNIFQVINSKKARIEKFLYLSQGFIKNFYFRSREQICIFIYLILFSIPRFFLYFDLEIHHTGYKLEENLLSNCKKDCFTKSKLFSDHM